MQERNIPLQVHTITRTGDISPEFPAA